MKKRTLLILSALLLVAIVSGAVLKRKTIAKVMMGRTSKSPYANIKVESKTMPDIYQELVNKSDPFSLYGRNDEMLPILTKKLEQDPNNLQLKFAVGLQNIYYGTTVKGIEILESLENDPNFMQNPDYTKSND